MSSIRKSFDVSLAVTIHSINEFFGMNLATKRYNLDYVKSTLTFGADLIKNHKTDMKDMIRTIQKHHDIDPVLLKTAYRQPYVIYNNMKTAVRYLHAAYCMKKFYRNIQDLEHKNDKSVPLNKEVVEYIANRFTPSAEYLSRHKVEK